jgi:polar amino acid transport system substrate-binding protein
MKRLLKIISGGVLTFALIFAVAGCGEAPNNNTAGKKTLKIGVFPDKPPFSSKDSSGTYQGYDIEFANRIGVDYDAKVDLVPVSAAERVDALTSGKVDLILANFTATKERSEKVDFTLPYQKVALGVVSPEDAQITSLDQLKGKDLIVIKGTTAETYFEENYPDIKLQKYDQYEDAQKAMVGKKGAAWANDDREVEYFAQTSTKFAVPKQLDHLGNEEYVAPAVKKGNTELYNWINKEIVKLGKEKFFHKDYTQNMAATYGRDLAESMIVEGGVVPAEAKKQNPWYKAIQ